MSDAERIRRLEKLLADYVMRYGATPEANDYFADMARENQLSEAERTGSKSSQSQC